MVLGIPGDHRRRARRAEWAGLGMMINLTLVHKLISWLARARRVRARPRHQIESGWPGRATAVPPVPGGPGRRRVGHRNDRGGPLLGAPGPALYSPSLDKHTSSIV